MIESHAHIRRMLRHDDTIAFIKVKHIVLDCKVRKQKRHVIVGHFRMKIKNQVGFFGRIGFFSDGHGQKKRIARRAILFFYLNFDNYSAAGASVAGASAAGASAAGAALRLRRVRVFLAALLSLSMFSL